jgi:PAS domain S-box-containing protein
MSTPLGLLLIDESASESELVLRELRRHGYEVRWQRVDSAPALRTALAEQSWDVVLCAHLLSAFAPGEAQAIVAQMRPELPFLIVAGAIPEAAAVEAMKAGARDVIAKSNLSRLGPVLDRELAEASNRRRVREGASALLDVEARMRAIVDSALDAVITMDHTGAILDFNPAAETMFGRARSEVAGKALAETIIPPSYRDAHWRGLNLFLSSGEAPILDKRLELVALRADGSEFPVELTVTHTRVQGQSLFTGSIRDLTERKRLEEQVRLGQRLESVGRLAGGIAHDFNNLLTVISGYVAILLDEDELGEREELRQIAAAAERAQRLTRQLLAFSRRQVLQPRVLDLNDVVEGLTPMLIPLIGEDVDLSSSLDPSLRAILADPTQVEQILVNLVVNARDAMPTGGKLTIETASVDLDAAYADRHEGVRVGPHSMIAVSDTGTGMTAETRTHLFEPFFTTKPSGMGTGLGLATVYGIVKQSGGNIWVYSEPGQGTTFKVYFPVTTDDAPGTELPPAPPARVDRNPETILLVEDDDGVRALAQKILERSGFTVLPAADPVDALSVATGHKGPIDLLLSDLVMPRGSGQELAQDLLERLPAIRVLFMSGYSDQAVVRHGALVEGAAFLEKPFSEDDLVRKVRETLDLPR